MGHKANELLPISMWHYHTDLLTCHKCLMAVEFISYLHICCKECSTVQVLNCYHIIIVISIYYHQLSSAT